MRFFGSTLFQLPFIDTTQTDGAPDKYPSHVNSRPVADAIKQPSFGVYNPNAVAASIPAYMMPTVPGNGGYQPAGLGGVVYDDQPMFNRNQDAGPVRSFFRRMMLDNRLRHV